jgi:hypothetical protein
MWLQKNPQLPQTPMGQYMDSQYAAADAQLRYNTAKQYADILQQLGYVDPTSGQFIQGSVESQANRQQADLQRQQQIADEQVTQQHQQLGTLFSGLRGTDQARADYPMVSAISDLQTQTPLTLQQLYEQAAGLTDQYTLAQNQNIADAASRAAANITANPPGGGPAAAAPAAPAAPADPNAGILALAQSVLPPISQSQAPVSAGGQGPNTPQLRGTAGITGTPTNPSAPPVAHAPSTGYYDPRTSRWVPR